MGLLIRPRLFVVKASKLSRFYVTLRQANLKVSPVPPDAVFIGLFVVFLAKHYCQLCSTRALYVNLFFVQL